LSATNLRYWQSLGFHPPKGRPCPWAATPSVATPCGSASIFGKWRIKGNKGNPICEQPSPLTVSHLPTSQSGRPPKHTIPSCAKNERGCLIRRNREEKINIKVRRLSAGLIRRYNYPNLGNKKSPQRTYFFKWCPRPRVEPGRCQAPQDFKSCASASYATT